MAIKNVVICGLGALGLTYANKLKDICELKILADTERINKYKNNPPKLNNKEITLNYITPTDNFVTDLIIISTKSTGLNTAIKYIKNFVNKNTIIISLINGIASEKLIESTYPDSRIIRSFFIGHSAVRIDNKVTQDGIGQIVIEPCTELENFFKNNNIDYCISKDIIYSQWVKLGVNIILNEPSAIYECTVGELRKNPEYTLLAKNLLDEVKKIAKLEGIDNIENYEKEVLDSIKLISDDGRTSMYQDILAKRKTEIDIFSGEILKLAKKLGIETPYNKQIYDEIKLKEASFKDA